jgi:hypothetical protein
MSVPESEALFEFEGKSVSFAEDFTPCHWTALVRLLMITL